MTLLHDAYTALLASLTTKTGNEIHWKDEDGTPITVELTDVSKEKYIIRYYYSNGNRRYEIECRDGKRHGKFIKWRENGNKHLETEFKNGKTHDGSIIWYE